MTRDIIYGVCDKLNECDSYYGFFKNYDDAIKEVSIQAKRLKEDLGFMDIQVKEDRAVTQISNREEQIVIVIHQYVLR